MTVERVDDDRVRLRAPLARDESAGLSAGDVVLVSGTVFAARDAAHARLQELADRGEPLPFEPEGAIVYYTGPTPPRPGRAVGSAGPTTAGRMDRYTPMLLERGVRAVMGKGGRGAEVREALLRHGAVALTALGGAGALAARSVRDRRVLAFEDLGPEALLELELDDLPAWVVVDAAGNDRYATAAGEWRRDDVLGAT